MRTIAVINQKGGVGKSTTSLNLAHALSVGGHKVLALDMDPQGHLAAGLGIVDEAEAGLDDVLLDDMALGDVLTEVRERMWLAPAGTRLAEFEMSSEGGAARGWKLHQALQATARDEDFVLIDCPPSTGLLAMNALFAATEVLIPVSSDFLSLHSLSRFMQVLASIDQALERSTRVWFVLTRYHDRRRLARDVRDRLVEYFPGSVLRTPIRECAPLAESPGFGQTVFEYRRSSNGAADYSELTQDLLDARTL
jgi:chromosome partitioning protein